MNGLTKAQVESICQQALAKAKDQYANLSACQSTYDKMAHAMKVYCEENGVFAAFHAVVDVGGPEGVTFVVYPYKAISQVALSVSVRG
jgi:hypothetical protein